MTCDMKRSLTIRVLNTARTTMNERSENIAVISQDRPDTNLRLFDMDG